MTLEIDIVTLFPAMLEGPLAASIPARILERGLAEIRVHDLRRWGLGRHRSVDDQPYGGGAGMVIRPEPDRGRPGRAPTERFDRDPARARRRAVPPGARPRAGRPEPPRPALPALRGHRRAGPGARRPGALDRRLRADRRRAAGARRRRRGPAAPARRDRRGLDRRGVVRRRAPRVPAVHPSGRRSRVAACRRS